MKISRSNLFRSALVTALVGVAACWPVLRAQSAPASGGGGTASLASLNEDVQLLTRQVNQLRLEVETLRQQNETLQKQVVTQRDIQTAVQNAVAQSRADTRGDIAASRKEILEGVAKQIDALTKDTNAQLQKLAKAIGESEPRVRSTGPAAPPAGGSPTASRKPDASYPTTGIAYTVKPRDSLSKIARENNSTTEWIQSANPSIVDPTRDLRPGLKIFIPQKPDASSAAAPAPAPATVSPSN